MADTAVGPIRLLQRDHGISSGLPPSMTAAELLVAVNHIVTVWWPQLCRSSHTQAMKDTGIFEEGWYDDNGLLDIQSPAYWKIVNGLGILYSKVDARYPNDPMGIFRIRWRVRRNGDMVALLAEGPPSDKKDYRGKRTKKGYRIKGPRSGWLDFQMEIDVLKASRDAADDTMNASNSAIAPKMSINGDGTLIHTSMFSTTSGPAFSPAQRKDIAEQVSVALTEAPYECPHSVALSDDKQTSAEVGKWITNQDSVVECPSDAASAIDGVGEATLEVSTVSAASTAILDMEDSAFDDEGWVKVGEGDEGGDFTVPVASTYVYKKADAKKPRKSGWLGLWYL